VQQISTQPEASAPSRKRAILMFLRDLLVIVLIAVLVSFLIKTFVMRAFYIPSTSMENTLLVDDRILVDELTPNWSSYSRGEIVVFKDPGGWLPPASTRADRSAFVEGIERFLTGYPPPIAKTIWSSASLGSRVTMLFVVMTLGSSRLTGSRLMSRHI
jgi:signal peptidase I